MMYAETEFIYVDPTDGHEHTLRAGHPVRVFAHGEPFGTAIILGFSKEGDAQLARPYAFASSMGTTCPTPLVWAEVYTITRNHAARLRPLSEHPMVA
jgi:hypothetical protein